jgi:predicted phage terminase large subunit-like protein
VAPFVESGNVHLPDPSLAPWIDEYIVEHTSFPNSPHDDQVDCTSQALHRLLGAQHSAEEARGWLRAYAST